MAMQTAGQRVALAVGIIVLAVAAVTAITIVKQRGEQARHTDTLKIASSDERKTPPKEGDSSSSSQDGKEQSDTPRTDDDARTKQDEPAPTNTAAQPESADQQDSEPQTATELPQTGAHGILAALPLSLVACAAVAYVQSRRA